MNLFDFLKPEKRTDKKTGREKALVIPLDINCWNYNLHWF